MDVSNTTDSSVILPEVYTFEERVFVASVVILVAITGSIGNTIVILAVAFSRKLQNSTYVFVTNLAICDLLTCLFLPWSAVALLSKHGWPLENAMWLCSASAFMVFACVLTSMYNLASIAINRYVLVCHTFETFTKTFSVRNICIMVTISWLIPFSIVLILPLLGVGRLGYDESGGNGCTDIDSSPGAKVFQWAQVIISVFPIVTIVVCYVLIFAHVKRHFKRQKRNMKKSHQISASVDYSVDMDYQGSGAPGSGANEKQSAGSNYHEYTQAKHHNSKQSKIPAKNHINMTNISTSGTDREDSASQLNNGALPEGDTISTAYSTVNRQERKQRKLRRQQLQVTGRLFLVVCAFFICITPYCITISIEGIPQRWIIYTSLLTIINSTINPAIYTLTHPQFTEIFAAIFKCRYKDIPQPSDFLRRF